MNYEDILYEELNGVATITINRPERYNAFRGQTCMELLDAFNRAGWNKEIGVIVFTGAGDKAFCTGGDQGAHEGQYDGRGLIGLPVEELQNLIREVPKPVIARVNGFAIGGGHVLHVVCDLSIASDKAVFGQVGPKVGSVDPGYGTAYLSRLIGEKRTGRSGTCAASTTRSRRWTGAWSTPWYPTSSSMKKCRSGARRFSRRARPRCPSPSARSMLTAPTSAVSAASACRP